MTADTERDIEAWRRVGLLLKKRRPQIAPRYRTRKVFAQETGLPDKTVQEIERAYRTTFSAELLAAFETAYLLAPGSITEALGDASLSDFPRKLDVPLPRRGEAVHIPPEVGLDKMEPWEAHLWRTPQLSIEDRQTLIDIQRRIRRPGT